MGKSGKKNGGALWRFIVWTVAFLVFVPVVEVLSMRFFNPIGTPLMLIRKIEGPLQPGPSPKLRYRWVDLKTVPDFFKKAAWQTEDARFFQHNGFDWKEMNLAVAEASRTGKPARGASTITMQCARSLFLWQGRSWIRKPIEAYYSILMEAILTKRRIFELYVNVVETGDGLYGIEAAAQHYWKIATPKLSLAQCAAIVAVLPNPRKRDPLHPSASMRRHLATVLRKARQSPKLPAGI